MKKLLVLATGWHYGYQFYENMISQQIPNGWDVDYFCVAHRLPEDQPSIDEKEDVRNYIGNDLLLILDKELYHSILTTQDIENFGWKFMIEENTIGDMYIFNQWAEKYDYSDYDMIFITHDDNLILSDQLFVDVLINDILLYKPLIETEHNKSFDLESVTNDQNWWFLDNGYTEHIPKAITPRGSFGFYTKELIDLMGGNFDIFNNPEITLTRTGEIESPRNHMDLNSWNTGAGLFRDFLYEGKENNGLINEMRFLSNTKRVSSYCIEGERGFIHNCRADGNFYVDAVKNIMERMND